VRKRRGLVAGSCSITESGRGGTLMVPWGGESESGTEKIRPVENVDTKSAAITITGRRMLCGGRPCHGQHGYYRCRNGSVDSLRALLRLCGLCDGSKFGVVAAHRGRFTLPGQFDPFGRRLRTFRRNVPTASLPATHSSHLLPPFRHQCPSVCISGSTIWGSSCHGGAGAYRHGFRQDTEMRKAENLELR